MGRPAAKFGDKITALDTHLAQPPGTVPPVPVLFPFSGTINTNLSPNVQIMGLAAATVGSVAINLPPHLPAPAPPNPGLPPNVVLPPWPFVNPPANRGTIQLGSVNVLINGKPAARAGDVALTCNDPVNLPIGTVVATGTVFIGG